MLLTLAGCGAGTPSGAGDEVIVFAAASLTDAFEELSGAFEASHNGVTVIRNYDSSSSLAIQLIEGASADVYASANWRQMEVAQEEGRIAGEPVSFATNRLVVLVPAANPAGITSLADLALPGLRLVLAAPSVPVRDYTDRMIESLAADPAYGPAYREAIYANLASEEHSVRQVVAKVALGEADAGIVYVSDVTPDVADRVLRIEIPEPYNVLATYPVGVVSNAPNPELAQEFIRFLLSEEGQAVLARWGFGPAPSGG